LPVGSFWPLPAAITYAPAGYGAPQLGEDDFVVELGNLFPPGKAWAWTRDPASFGIALLHGIAASQAATHARKNQMLIDAFPATTVELLPEWEASVGLPDPCAGPDASVPARQAHVVARATNQGGQSVAYLIAYALALGFVITITQFTVLRFGQRFGSRFRGARWASAIQINAPTTTIAYARFGSARFGDHFASWGNAILECELRRIAPGHLTLIFSYGG